MIAGHAPGPWRFQMFSSVFGIYDSNGRSVANLQIKRTSDALSNARLIAAAPDLLAVLQALDERGHTQATWALAKAAIAKATGQ